MEKVILSFFFSPWDGYTPPFVCAIPTNIGVAMGTLTLCGDTSGS